MVIAYLYGDLLNLYGNDGNIKILAQKLTEAGVKAEIRNISTEDKLDFSEYDMVYMGSGTEENQKIAIKALKPYKEEIEAAVDKGKLFLITGNSPDIFGQKLDGVNIVEDVKGLGVFDYYSEYVPRIKMMYRNNDTFLDDPVLGFLNHNYRIKDNKNPLFGSDDVRVNNFFGTHLEGPVLIRNPHFLKFILSILIGSTDAVEKIDFEMEKKAYDAYMSLLVSDGGDKNIF
ncbi:MAG: hypothetical protein Q4F78_08545 [Bacillota bacterium]|nr:hypothetical protein [Bacillota bacterium]